MLIRRLLYDLAQKQSYIANPYTTIVADAERIAQV